VSCYKPSYISHVLTLKTNEMCCLERKKIYFLFFPSCTKFGIIDIFLAKNERKKINANYWERKYLVRV
jgi:hypothetical protein